MAIENVTLTVAGCRIRAMRKGTGQPLLYLHGPADAGVWLPVMDALAERFDVIVPEHPGFGGSDTPEWLDSVSDLAFFYLDLIDAMGLTPVHLVGASIGGWTSVAPWKVNRSTAASRSGTWSAKRTLPLTRRPTST